MGSAGSTEVASYRLWYAGSGRCQVTFDPLRTLGILSAKQYETKQCEQKKKKKKTEKEFQKILPKLGLGSALTNLLSNPLCLLMLITCR